jgi:RHS repeat-associated protein
MRGPILQRLFAISRWKASVRLGIALSSFALGAVSMAQEPRLVDLTMVGAMDNPDEFFMDVAAGIAVNGVPVHYAGGQRPAWAQTWSHTWGNLARTNVEAGKPFVVEIDFTATIKPNASFYFPFVWGISLHVQAPCEEDLFYQVIELDHIYGNPTDGGPFHLGHYHGPGGRMSVQYIPYFYDENGELAQPGTRWDTARAKATATLVVDFVVPVGSVWLETGFGADGSGSRFTVAASASEFGRNLAFDFDPVGSWTSFSPQFVGVHGRQLAGSATGPGGVPLLLFLTDKTVSEGSWSGDVYTLRVFTLPWGEFQTAEAAHAAVAGHSPLKTVTFVREVLPSGLEQLTVSESPSGSSTPLATLVRSPSGSGPLTVIHGGGGAAPRSETSYLAAVHNGQPGAVSVEASILPDGTRVPLRSVGRYGPAAAAPLAGSLWFEEPAGGPRSEFDREMGSYDAATDAFSPDSSGAFLRARRTVGRPGGGSGFLVANRSERETTVEDASGRRVFESLEVWDGSGWSLLRTVRRSHDADGRLESVVENGRTVYGASYEDGRMVSETDAFGIVTEYSDFDAQGSPTTITRKGAPAAAGFAEQPDVVTMVAQDGDERVEIEVGGSESRITETTWSGGSLASRTEKGLTTTYSGSNPQTVTYPSGATETRWRDDRGRTASVYGTAVTAESHTYDTDPDTGNVTHTATYGGWPQISRTTVTDALGRRIREERPSYLDDSSHGAHVRQFHYCPDTGRLVRESATGMADRIYEYDPDLGELRRVGYDLDGNGTLDLASGDRIEQTDTVYAQEAGQWHRVTTRRVARTPGSAALSVESVFKERLTLPEGYASWTVEIDASGDQTVRTVQVDRAAKLVTETVSRPGVARPEVRVTRNGLLQTSRAPRQSSPVRYGYDGLGRLASVRDPGLGTVVEYGYNLDDQLESIVTRSADGLLSSAELLEYHPQGTPGAGRIASRTVNGKATRHAYDLRGNVVRTWGAEYPVRREFDALNRLWKLHTYRDASFDLAGGAWPEGDLTTWTYHPHTGQLIAKTDAAGRSVRYRWHPSGLIWRVERARPGHAAVYVHTRMGELESIHYEAPAGAPATPPAVYAYHRDGRRKTLTDGAGLRTFAYDAFGRLEGESYGTGLLDGLSVRNPRDSLGRPRYAALNHGGPTLHRSDYAYDPETGLLASVSSGGAVARYAWRSDSAWIDAVSHRPLGTHETFRTTREPDGLGRLKKAGSWRSSGGFLSPLGSHDYGYDAQGRRETAALADGSAWDYGYGDAYGQVTSAAKSAGGTPLPGHQFGYSFDDIGNRIQTTVSGRAAHYLPNALNQYEERGVPAFLEVRGSAGTNAAVAVDGLPAERAGSAFRREVALPNAAGPAYAEIEVEATLPGTALQVSETRAAFVPKHPEAFEYDEDGNLKRDGRWEYVWDSENRLIGMETLPAAHAAGAPRQRLTFAYDAQWRRIRKQTETWDPSSALWLPSSDSRFIYDGWNLIAELQPDPVQPSAFSLQLSFSWGLDLSGTTQGAGGVGGLLWAEIHDGPASGRYAAGYDGNGNVVLWADLQTGRAAGSRDYAAFGESVAISGVARQLPFGFSTKYEDETGLLYYGFRYYSPSLGRWLSRDPIEEQGGVNLYGFSVNDAVGRFDLLGLSDHPVWAPGSTLAWYQERLPHRIVDAATLRMLLGVFNHFVTIPAEFDDPRYELDYRNEAAFFNMITGHIKARMSKSQVRGGYGYVRVNNEDLLGHVLDHITAKGWWGSKQIGGSRGMIGDGQIEVRCRINESGNAQYSFLLIDFKWTWVDEYEFKSWGDNGDAIPPKLLESILLRGYVHGIVGLDMPYSVRWNAGWHTIKHKDFLW